MALLQAGEEDVSLVSRIATEMRAMVTAGEFLPGQKLAEAEVAARFAISRNSLREVFRLLTSQRLLTYIPNRGVYVAAPDAADVVDIYRVRAVIQKGAIRLADPTHPAMADMEAVVRQSEAAGQEGDWRRVGTLNMEFHRAMVALADSPRLSQGFDLVLAELRLVFGQLPEGAHLHEPYIAMNADLVAALRAGDGAGALERLEAYLLKSERAVLAALQRQKGRPPGGRTGSTP